MTVMDEVKGAGRWSANNKQDAVLRLLRGEKLDVLSRELRVEAHRLAACRDEFRTAGKAGLKGRLSGVDDDDGEAGRRLREAERKVGELALEPSTGVASPLGSRADG